MFLQTQDSKMLFMPIIYISNYV